MPPLARAALTSLALPAALNARPRSEECTHTSVVVDFIEVSDACEIGHLGGPGFASPLHGRLEAGPNVQPIAVARPAPHGTNDRGRCALGEERCGSSDAQRVGPELIGVLSNRRHQLLDDLQHEGRLQWLVGRGVTEHRHFVC